MLKLKNYSTWRSHGHTKVNFYEEIDGSSENNYKSTHPGSDVLLSLIMQLLSPPPSLVWVTVGTFNGEAAGVLGGRSLSSTSLLLVLEGHWKV